MKTKILLFATAIMMAMSFGAYAQAPEKFNYQGIARDNNGNALANQALGLQISILDGSTAEYVETHSATTNDFGLYTIAIGDGTAVTGTMSGIDWSAGSKSIKVEIDPSGGTSYTDLGTTELLSVPYAIYASKTPGIVAHGHISDDGTIDSGTGNFTVNYESSLNRYRISITGVSYLFSNYTTLVTTVGSSAQQASYNSVGGDLLIYIFDSSGSHDVGDFSFIVYE